MKDGMNFWVFLYFFKYWNYKIKRGPTKKNLPKTSNILEPALIIIVLYMDNERNKISSKVMQLKFLLELHAHVIFSLFVHLVQYSLFRVSEYCYYDKYTITEKFKKKNCLQWSWIFWHVCKCLDKEGLILKNRVSSYT